MTKKDILTVIDKVMDLQDAAEDASGPALVKELVVSTDLSDVDIARQCGASASDVTVAREQYMAAVARGDVNDESNRGMTVALHLLRTKEKEAQRNARNVEDFLDYLVEPALTLFETMLTKAGESGPRGGQLTCEQFKSLVWLLSKWSLDAAFAPDSNIEPEQVRTMLDPFVHCAGGSATCQIFDVGADSGRFNSVTRKALDACGADFLAGAVSDHASVFALYADMLVANRFGDHEQFAADLDQEVARELEALEDLEGQVAGAIPTTEAVEVVVEPSTVVRRSTQRTVRRSDEDEGLRAIRLQALQLAKADKHDAFEEWGSGVWSEFADEDHASLTGEDLLSNGQFLGSEGEDVFAGEEHCLACEECLQEGAGDTGEAACDDVCERCYQHQDPADFGYQDPEELLLMHTFDVEEPVPRTRHEEYLEEGAMALYRVQRLNRDLAAARCARIRLEAKHQRDEAFPEGLSPSDIPECKHLVKDLLWRRLAQEQAESKCCCVLDPQKDLSNNATFAIPFFTSVQQQHHGCEWHKKDKLRSRIQLFSLVHLACPASASYEVESDDLEPGRPRRFCGESPLDSVRASFFGHTRSLGVSAGGSLAGEFTALLEVGAAQAQASNLHELSEEQAEKAVTALAGKQELDHLSQLEQSLSAEREKVVGASGFARSSVAWYPACDAGKEVHVVERLGVTKKKQKKCDPVPANSPVMACPDSLNTYCYDEEWRRKERCCCASGGVETTGGRFTGKTKKASAMCKALMPERPRDATLQRAPRDRPKSHNPFATPSMETPAWQQGPVPGGVSSGVSSGPSSHAGPSVRKDPEPPATHPTTFGGDDTNFGGDGGSDSSEASVDAQKRPATPNVGASQEERDTHEAAQQQARNDAPVDTAPVDTAPAVEDPFAYYEACRPGKKVHTVRTDRKSKCQEARKSGSCPMRDEHDLSNTVSFAWFCYEQGSKADQVEAGFSERCCCRTQHIHVSGSWSKTKIAGPDCGRDWPTYIPNAAPEVVTQKAKPGGFFGFFGKGTAEKRDTLPQFNDVFYDNQAGSGKGPEKWTKNERDYAKKFRKEIEKFISDWVKLKSKGKMWRCDEAVGDKRCALQPDGKSYLRQKIARGTHLSKRIHKLIARNDAKNLGNPSVFELTTKCALGVLEQYRKNRDVKLQAFDSGVRTIARDFTHLNMESAGTTVASGFGNVLGVIGRGITAVVSGLLYLVTLPVVWFAEGVRSVENSGSLWYFPVGFFFRGPVISIFGKAHWQWTGDFGSDDDNDFFRWGVWGAVKRGWNVFHRPSGPELAQQVPGLVKTLAHLHRILNMAEQCGDTVSCGK